MCMIGARVGNWFVEAELARGTQGVVYRARRYDDPQRQAAVKLFTAVRDTAALSRWPAELLPLQRLDHVNIVKIYESGFHGGLAFVATELIEGTDCAQRLESGRLPWREVLSVAVQAARALKHAHNRNVLHRDLKPGHFLLTPDGTLKILAFGIAKILPPPPVTPPPSAPGRIFRRKRPVGNLSPAAATCIRWAAYSILS